MGALFFARSALRHRASCGAREGHAREAPLLCDKAAARETRRWAGGAHARWRSALGAPAQPGISLDVGRRREQSGESPMPWHSGPCCAKGARLASYRVRPCHGMMSPTSHAVAQCPSAVQGMSMPYASWAHAICTVGPCHMHRGPMPYARWASAICTVGPCHMHGGPVPYASWAHAICTVGSRHMHRGPMPFASWAHAICIVGPCHMHGGPMPYARWAHAICIVGPCHMHGGLAPYARWARAICIVGPCHMHGGLAPCTEARAGLSRTMTMTQAASHRAAGSNDH